MARRGRGDAADRTADRAVAPDGVAEALNGVEGPGARTMGALAVVRWAAQDPGEPAEELDEGRPPLTQGPYDEGDLDPEHTEADRVDFGAVRIPVPRGGQVSVEPEEGRLQAVHVMLPAGRLSVSALAAPRTARLWPDLAAEIDESLREGGATVRSFTGPWGRELHARTGEAASVFVGVDGPRWMLYGVATGPTGAAKELDAALRRMLRGVVVVRGRAPYPVRTVLPLTVPEHLAAPGPAPVEAERVPSARSGRFLRRPGPPARPVSTGPAPAPPRVAPAPAALPDPGGVPTEPHGLRPVASAGTNGASAGTNGHAHGRAPYVNGVDALRSGPDRRSPFPTGNGRPPAERPEPDVSSTGQRRVADLLAEAQRERAAQQAQREARERAAAQEARERAAAQARERAVQEARERAAAEARERAAQEARERAAQERAAQEAQRERAAAEARERAAREAWEREAWERESRERAARERVAQQERAVGQPPAAYRPAWSPAEPRPGLLAGPSPVAPAEPLGVPRNGRRPDDHRDVAALRLGGPPRAVGAGAEEPRYDPVRPVSDGSDDWTLPMAVVPPEPARGPEAPPGQAEPDLWAGDPWAAETRRAARAARAAERPPVEGRGRREPDPEPPAYRRPPQERAAHHRPAHAHPGDAPVGAPAARIPPPLPVWAHLPDDRADPFDEQASGRHRRPDR